MSEYEDSVSPQPEPGSHGIPPRPPKRTARGLDEEPDYDGSILDEIEQRLARYPQARVRRDESSISCFPSDADGFVVRLKVRRRHGCEYYTVFYKGSQVEFTHRQSAVIEFGFGLSNGCRVKEYSRKGIAYRWIVELWDVKKNCWMPVWNFDDWHRLLWGTIVKFWYPPTIRYLQNTLIDLYSDGQSAAA